jgi:hypothetical protein
MLALLGQELLAEQGQKQEHHSLTGRVEVAVQQQELGQCRWQVWLVLVQRVPGAECVLQRKVQRVGERQLLQALRLLRCGPG